VYEIITGSAARYNFGARYNRAAHCNKEGSQLANTEGSQLANTEGSPLATVCRWVSLRTEGGGNGVSSDDKK